MASFVNSFALLEGEARQSSASANKKKKNKKSKKAGQPSLPPSGAQQDGLAETAPANSEAAAAADEDGFQPAGKHSRKGSTGGVNLTAAASSSRQLSVAEGIADLENAASQTLFRSSADRVKQWRYWQQQVDIKI